MQENERRLVGNDYMFTIFVIAINLTESYYHNKITFCNHQGKKDLSKVKGGYLGELQH